MSRFNRTIDTSVKFKNPWWTYRVDNYKLINGNTAEYHYVDTFGSTFVIPITNDDKFVMVKQFRYLNNRYSTEFPGGGQKEFLTPLENIIEELREETGYLSNKIHELGVFNPYNGVTNEICKVYVAKDLIKGESQLEESEEIEIVYLTEKEIDKMIISNELWDGMTLAAWALYKLKKGELL